MLRVSYIARQRTHREVTCASTTGTPIVCREPIGWVDIGCETANIVGYGESEQEGRDSRQIIDATLAGIPNMVGGGIRRSITNPY